MRAKKQQAALKLAFRAAYPRVPVDQPKYLRTHKDADGVPYQKGRYTLGVGRHGKVIKAYSMQDDAYVAIKSERRTGRTSAEELIHRSLKTPYVIKVKEVRDIGAKHFIVMELGDRTLKDLLAKPEDMTRAQVDRITHDLLQGLKEMHSEGVYHRDVKLGNVVLVGERAKIIDFGKSIRKASAAMKRTYERSDAWAACRVIATLDAAQRDPAGSTLRRHWAADRHPLLVWAQATPHMSIEKIMGHPSVHHLFPETPASSDGNVASRAMSQAALPFRKSFAWAMSKWPPIRNVE